jgi:Ran GTPase-activating protein (RanGAP) involved in mRNA processing and transport
LAELKGVSRSWRALAQRVLCSRLCRRDGQPVPTRLDEITDLDVEQLIEAGRPGDAAVAGRMLPGLARLHGYGYVVDVAAVRAADLQCGMGDWRRPSLLHGAAKEALHSCISGEGEPPLRLTIAAVACAGLGVVCGIPVQQMREDSVTELDLSDRGLHVAAAMLIAYLLPATSVLKKCNLLKNSFDIESATMLAKIGADKGIMLTSMTRDQTKADLSGQDLQPADTILIGSDLKFMTVLTDLSLGNNCIGPEGAKAIMGALSSGTSAVTNLELHGNDIGDEGSIAIAEALQSGTSVVTSLNLRYNQIGKEGAIAIAKALKSGTSVLITLHLGSNNIGDDGARAIAGALSSGTAVLTTLGLGSNKISDDGAKAMAGALSSGTTVLTELRLYYNNIGDDGAKAIADSLNSGTAVLTTLRLDTNKIGDEGAKAIAGALSSGTGVLTTLWLGSNSMGDAGKQALQDAVKDRSGFMLHL